ncbi:MAG TPA: hypothetical protein VEG64_09180 [Candidatus Sulfotelmatobacter sp.]|nr:hypothetical protein [Candidatus Sulfotelmatobacter sp.]
MRFRFIEKPHPIHVADCARQERTFGDLTVAELEQLIERDRDPEHDVNTLRPSNEKYWRLLRDFNQKLRDFWSKH